MWEVKLKVVSVCTYISLLLGAILWHLVIIQNIKTMLFLWDIRKKKMLDHFHHIYCQYQQPNGNALSSLQLHCVSPFIIYNDNIVLQHRFSKILLFSLLQSILKLKTLWWLIFQIGTDTGYFPATSQVSQQPLRGLCYGHAIRLSQWGASNIKCVLSQVSNCHYVLDSSYSFTNISVDHTHL